MTRGEIWWIDYGILLGRDSVMLLSQIGVIDKKRLMEKVLKVNK
jgi:mRNA-degrading endonuclease toxin of MazEF toxin-antitoxin module